MNSREAGLRAGLGEDGEGGGLTGGVQGPIRYFTYRGFRGRSGGGARVAIVARGRSLLFTPVALGVFPFHFVGGDDDEGGKGNNQESDGGDAVQLIEAVLVHVAVEKSEAGENKEKMGAENLQRGPAEGQERLDGHKLDEVFAGP